MSDPCTGCGGALSVEAEQVSSRLHTLPAEGVVFLTTNFQTPVRELRLCSACLVPALSQALKVP